MISHDSVNREAHQALKSTMKSAVSYYHYIYSKSHA